MTGLEDHVRARVQLLVNRQQEIRRLAAQNPSFTGDLLRGELVKTDKLVDAFIDLAVTCSRYEHYLTTVDVAARRTRARPVGDDDQDRRRRGPGDRHRKAKPRDPRQASRQGEGDPPLPRSSRAGSSI